MPFIVTKLVLIGACVLVFMFGLLGALTLTYNGVMENDDLNDDGKYFPIYLGLAGIGMVGGIYTYFKL